MTQHSRDPLSRLGFRHAQFHPQGHGRAARQILRQTRLANWSIVYTKQAQKDADKLVATNLKPHAQRLLDIIARNPLQNPPPYEKLIGDLAGASSRRINIQHRLVYQVYETERTIKVVRRWTHYE